MTKITVDYQKVQFVMDKADGDGFSFDFLGDNKSSKPAEKKKLYDRSTKGHS